MPGDPKLRKALSEATQMRTAEDYRSRIRALKSEFDGFEALYCNSSELQWFNCYAYAMGVFDEARYLNLARKKGTSVLVNSEFVNGMLNRNTLAEVQEADAQPGDIGLYFAGNALQHAGRIHVVTPCLIIRSKWGPHEVHEHSLWAVPAEYGDLVRYFRCPASALVLDRLEIESVHARDSD
jgi:hypothetical protein